MTEEEGTFIARCSSNKRFTFGGQSNSLFEKFALAFFDPLSPYLSVPLGFMIFCLLALASYSLDLLEPPSFRAPLAISFGLIWYLIGVRLGERMSATFMANLRFKLSILALLCAFISISIWELGHEFFVSAIVGLSSSYILNRWLNFSSKEAIEKISLVLILVGFTATTAFLIAIGGIPLIDQELRSRSNMSVVRGLSYSAFIFGISVISSTKQNIRVPFSSALTGMVLFSLLGFRFEPLGILLTASIILWYRRMLSKKLASLTLLLLALTVVLIGYLKVPSQWILDPVDTLFHRAGLTLNTLDKILKMSLPFGLTFGQASFTPPRSRVIVGMEVYGYNQSITSTLIGAAALDFGFIGIVLIMIYFGAMMGAGYSLLKSGGKCWCCFIGYSLATSHTLLLIESGVDFTMWMLTLFIWFLYAKIGEFLIKPHKNS